MIVNLIIPLEGAVDAFFYLASELAVFFFLALVNLIARNLAVN